MQEIFQGTNFGTIDWVIVALYLSISIVIGWVVKKYIADMSDYVAAGRGVRTALGIATITGTELGLVTVMFKAQKGFVGGFSVFHIAIAVIVAYFFVGATGFIITRLRSMKVLTIPEFYEKRFGRKTRILGAITLVIGGVLNMGLFLKIGSLFIVAITGLPEGPAINIVMVILLAIVLFYTVLGGMVSVVITDYIQYVVLTCGAIIAIFFAVKFLGWDNLFSSVLEHKGEAGFNPFVKGTFGVEYTIWMFLAALTYCVTWPPVIARVLAAKDTKTIKRIYGWTSITSIMISLFPFFFGICAFVFVMEMPQIKDAFFPAAGGAEALDSLYALPVFFSRILPTGIIGIMTAAMLAAFMSTQDSYLLSWSTVITQDIVAPLAKKKLSPGGRIKLTRLFIILLGLYVLYWGLVYTGKQDIFDYMVVTSAIYQFGAFPLLLFGLYWKRASSTGAVIALLCGFLAILGLEPVQRAFGFGLSTAWVALGAISLAMVSMVLFSLLFPDRKQPELNFKG